MKKICLLFILLLTSCTAETQGYSYMVYQMPQLPNGCEITSLTMLLKRAGIDADKLDLYDDYLAKEDVEFSDGVVYGPDPETAYAGNAYDEAGSWYCYEEPIQEAGNAYLADIGSDLTVVDMTGIKEEEMNEMLLEGNAFVAWVTIDFEEPDLSSYIWIDEDGDAFHPYTNLHCVLVDSINEEDYVILDPLEGAYDIDADTFWDVFEAMGSRALTLQ